MLVFHVDCLLRWFVNADTCPVCRESSPGDMWVKFRELVADDIREKYKDAIESLEHDLRVIRRRQSRVIFD